MVYKLFNKKIGLILSVNEEPTQELHKLVIKKSKRRNVYTRFKDDIQAADLAQMGSLPCTNGSVKYALFEVDDFTIYDWIRPLKDENLKQFFTFLLKQ